MCSFQGCGRISFEPCFQPTRVQTLQRITGTAGQCLALPVNDGIIQKHSSQYSGLMSIYLQGVCSSLPFYLSKHIWCPVAGASNRNVCFPEDACSLFMQFCALVVWLRSVRQKSPPVRLEEIFPATLVEVGHVVIFPLCMFQSQWHEQYMFPIKNILNLSYQWLTPSLSFRQQELLLSLREPLHFIHLSMLLPRI